MFSAKFMYTPSNQRGIESIRADSSTMVVYEPLYMRSRNWNAWSQNLERLLIEYW